MASTASHKLIVFVSGRGSNAQAIHHFFKDSDIAEISLLVTNKADAGAYDWAITHGIPATCINRSDFNSPAFIESIKNENPALIVLAGFLWKLPEAFVAAFPKEIINIHPALLPAYGGKGMWGHHVHEAVLACGDLESGITIHRVNEEYDKGSVLLQARCNVLPEDDSDALAARVLKLEHYFYPRLIEFLLAQ